MATMYCALCSRPVEGKRHIGVGTVALAVLSGGLWLIAIPFYPKRCSICRSTALSETAPVAGGIDAIDRLTELEQRLSLAEGELEAASAEIERLRTEQDFYRQLLEAPDARARAGQRRIE